MKRQRLAATVDTARALRALAWTTLLFRLGGQRRVARAAGRAMAVTPHASAAHGVEVWRAYRAVQRARRVWPGEVLCLQTALVLHDVLMRRGVSAMVRIGVNRDAGAVDAHAWVEAGAYVLDPSHLHGAFAAFEQVAEAEVRFTS